MIGSDRVETWYVRLFSEMYFSCSTWSMTLGNGFTSSLQMFKIRLSLWLWRCYRGSLFSNFFLSTHFVFAHQPMHSRSFHGKRILRYQASVMRAEMMMRAITMFTKSKITKFIPLAGIVHWCQYPWTLLEWQIMKMTTFKDVTSGTLCVKFYRPLAGPVQGTGWWGSKSWQSWPPSACPGSGKTKIFMVRWLRVGTTWNM